jgi:AraC-like DNA-binding protein
MKTSKKEKQIVETKMGRRPISLSDEQIRELEDLARDLTIEQIADYFGMCEKTFHELKNRDSAVFTAYKKGKSRGIKEVAGKLRGLIDQGDTAATIFYLKTRAGWSDKQLIETKDITPKQPPTIINNFLPDPLPSESVDEK